MKKLFNVFYKVGFIYALGFSIMIIFALIVDFIFSAHLYETVTETVVGFYVGTSLGLLSLSLSIIDGQFVEDLKDSHWASKALVEWHQRKYENVDHNM